MKLSQIHNFTPVTFEITDFTLKINAQKLLGKKVHEIPFKDIFIKDIYEIDDHKKTLLKGLIFVFAAIFGTMAEHLFLAGHGDWTIPSIFGLLAIICAVPYFMKKTTIYIPTKEHGMIRLHHNLPSKKKVQNLIYVLEGKVSLAIKKMPIKEDLSRFLKRD